MLGALGATLGVVLAFIAISGWSITPACGGCRRAIPIRSRSGSPGRRGRPCSGNMARAVLVATLATLPPANRAAQEPNRGCAASCIENHAGLPVDRRRVARQRRRTPTRRARMILSPARTRCGNAGEPFRTTIDADGIRAGQAEGSDRAHGLLQRGQNQRSVPQPGALCGTAARRRKDGAAGWPEPVVLRPGGEIQRAYLHAAAARWARPRSATC